jgi:uncharacterized protein
MILDIEVIYAPAGSDPWRCFLQAQAPYTVQQAIADAQLLQQFPEIKLFDLHKIGVFGKPVSLNTLLNDQDRLEIYSPLIQNPKALRRKRAIKKTNYQPSSPLILQ